LLGWWRSSGRF